VGGKGNTTNTEVWHRAINKEKSGGSLGKSVRRKGSLWPGKSRQRNRKSDVWSGRGKRLSYHARLEETQKKPKGHIS